MAIRFSGLIAPTEVPTGDGRMFANGKLTSRPMPIPLMVRFGSGGHDGATVVGKVNRIFDGPGGYWGEGEFLDPAIVPEVPKAVYMINEHVMGPSVDLDRDFTVEAVKHPLRPDKKAGLFKEYNVIGVTLVPMPAFHQVHLSVDGEADKTLLASVMPDLDTDSWPVFDVNGESWKSWPVAPRDYKFDADDAVKRIAYWAGIGSKQPSLDGYASAFLWRNGNQVGDSLAQDSFRLPLCDIINNQPYLIYHAAYAAAALLSGAHGGLPNIPDQDKHYMIPVINEIYAKLAHEFNDPNLTSPFMEGVRQQQAAIGDGEDCGCDGRFDMDSGEEHTGSMIALLPTKEDAARLASIGDEEEDQLHCTLCYLGDSADLSENARESVVAAVRRVFANMDQIKADGSSVNVFNPPGAQEPDEKDYDTCIVLGVSGPEIAKAKAAADMAVGLSDTSYTDEHLPYVAHVTLAYTDDLSRITDLAKAAGPISFDRVRVAFGGENVDIPLRSVPMSDGGSGLLTITNAQTGTSAASSIPVNNITITFTPSMPSMPYMPSMNAPMDVVKSMDEEKDPYDDSGCHFDENGKCAKCGY